jgi:uncharacterized Ntn-hydrolase superfamily protein
MNCCIVARCARTGRLGVGIASEDLAVGLQCDGAIRPRIGATLTLGAPTPAHNRLAMNLLEQGYARQHVLSELCANDPEHARRQIAIIDREGRTAVYHGACAPNAAAYSEGEGCIAMIDGLPGEAVVGTLRGCFENSAALDLDARLLATLEAMAAAGGVAWRSVALVVYGDRDYSDIDLRVDMHAQPIAALRRLYDEYQPFGAYYDERARNPRQALPQREFADMLARAREGTS